MKESSLVIASRTSSTDRRAYGVGAAGSEEFAYEVMAVTAAPVVAEVYALGSAEGVAVVLQ